MSSRARRHSETRRGFLSGDRVPNALPRIRILLFPASDYHWIGSSDRRVYRSPLPSADVSRGNYLSSMYYGVRTLFANGSPTRAGRGL